MRSLQHSRHSERSDAMSTDKTQDTIDSAGRLAAIIDHLHSDCDLMDVLIWCEEANVTLGRSTTAASEAIARLAEDTPP